jgi:hypothetical protein
MADQTISLDYTTSDGRKLPVTFKVPKEKISFDSEGKAFGSDENKQFIQQAAQQAFEARYPNEAGIAPGQSGHAGSKPSQVVKPYHWLDSDNEKQTPAPGTGEKGFVGGLRRALAGPSAGKPANIPVISPLASSTGESVRGAIETPISGKSWQGKTADVLEGAGSVIMGGFAPQIASSPALAARTILPSIGLGYGASKVAEKLGAEPDTTRLAGDIGAYAGGALGSPKISSGLAEGIKNVYRNPPKVNRFGPAGMTGAGIGFAIHPSYTGILGGGFVGAGAEAAADSGITFGRGALRGAANKPWLPPEVTDSFQAKAPSRPSPVVNAPKALPPSPVITTPPSVPSQIEGPGAGLRPAVNAPAQLSQGPIATPSPLPEPVPPSRQLNQPMPWRGPGDLNTGQPQVTAPMLSNQPAAVPKTPIAPVQPPAPVAQRPLVSAPVQAPPVQAAPPPVQAPVQIQTPPAAPPEPITPMQAPAVPGEPVKPPLAPSANIPVRATSRELEVNDLYKTPESIIPFIKNKVDISAANLARDSSVSLDHAARLLKAANEKGLIVTAKKGQYAWKSEPKNPVHAPESKVKPKVSVEPSLEDLPGPTDAELGPKDNVVTDEDRAMGKAARKVNPPTRQREITVNKPGEKPSVSKETKTTQKAPDAEQPAEDKGSSGGQQEQKDQNAKTVVKNYDKAALGFSDSAHVDRALFAALGKTKLPRAEWKKFYASEFPDVESLDDMSTNQKLQLIEKVTGKELSPKDKGKPFPESSFGKDSKSGKYGFGF